MRKKTSSAYRGGTFVNEHIQNFCTVCTLKSRETRQCSGRSVCQDCFLIFLWEKSLVQYKKPKVCIPFTNTSILVLFFGMKLVVLSPVWAYFLVRAGLVLNSVLSDFQSKQALLSAMSNSRQWYSYCFSKKNTLQRSTDTPAPKTLSLQMA